MKSLVLKKLSVLLLLCLTAILVQAVDYPRFAAVSDCHIGRGKDDQNKLRKTLKILVSQTPKLDAIFIVGDITDSGTANQYSTLKSIIDAEVPSSTGIKVVVMMGNHDYIAGNYDGTGRINHNQTFPGQYHQYLEIKGYPFITLSHQNYNGFVPNTGDEANDPRTFLTEKLQDAAQNYSGKPIFVFFHKPANGTVYGTNNEGGSSWGMNHLTEILKPYKQIIAFSGHSHYPIGDERSIDQGNFTAINVGELSYGEVEKGFVDGIHPEGSESMLQGAYVSIKENGDVLIDRYDFANDVTLKTPWLIEAPHDGTKFKYTSSRTGGNAPYFEAGQKPTITNVKSNSCTITYPQGKDDDVVHHYIIETINTQTGLVEKSFSMFSRFYVNIGVPATLTWPVEGLKSGTQYKISVKAVDSFGKISTPPIESDLFTTNNYEPNPSVVAPVADLFNVAFGPNDYAVDLSAAKQTIGKVGNGITRYDSNVKMYTSRFPGDGSKFFHFSYKDNTAFKSAIGSNFTVECFCKQAIVKDHCPFSAQESGGLGIELNSKAEFWAHLGGGYKKVGSTIPNTTDYYHYVFTYDGTALRCYTNGNPDGELAISSSPSIAFPNNAEAHRFIIGGDANGNLIAQYPFNGDVVIARLYDKAVSRDEAVRLYEQIEDRLDLQKVGNLNTALTVTLPAKISQLQGDAKTVSEALLQEGWNMMYNIKTTDAEIENFLTKIDNVSAIKSAWISPVNICVNDKNIIIEGMKPFSVFRIYNLQGIKVYENFAEENKTIVNIQQKGNYILQCEDYSFKFIY